MNNGKYSKQTMYLFHYQAWLSLAEDGEASVTLQLNNKM